MKRLPVLLCMFFAALNLPASAEQAKVTLGNDLELVSQADQAWQAWINARNGYERGKKAEPWETEREFQSRIKKESLKASAAEMAVFDKAIANLRAASFVEPADSVVLKVQELPNSKDSFSITLSGKDGVLAYEGSVNYKAKTANQIKILKNPVNLPVTISYKLFPLGDFGGKYREVARKIEFGGIAIDVLQIKDFSSGQRRKASKAALFESIYVEGGHPVINPFQFYADGDLIKPALSFYASATLVSQELFLEVTGFNPSPKSDDRLAPWRPVCNVTWNESAKFCNLLSKLDGYDPVYAPNSEDSYNVNLKSNGWRMQNFEEYYYAAVGGAKARFRGQIGGDGPDFMLIESDDAAMPLVGDSAANELGFRDIYSNLQFWEPTGGRDGMKTTFYVADLSKFGGNFDLGPNLRFKSFSFRIMRNGASK